MINSEEIQLNDLPEEFRAVAERIGLKAALDLVDGFAGCQLYVPKPETLARNLFIAGCTMISRPAAILSSWR